MKKHTNGRIVGKSNRERYLTWQEILKLPPTEIVSTIKSQGRSTLIENQLLEKAGRYLYQKSKNDYITRRITTLLNNLEYLKKKYGLTNDIIDEMMIKYSALDKPIRYNNFSFSTGLKNLADVFEYAFAYGYAFNVSMQLLLTENLEYLDSINCVDPFEHRVGAPTDVTLPVIVNNTAVYKKDLMRKINRSQRTGIKNRDL